MYYIIWGLSYVKRKLPALFRGWVTRNEAGELGYMNRTCLLQAALHETKPFAPLHGCWHRSRAGLQETKALASFGGWVTQDRAHAVVWELVCAKRSRWLCWGLSYTRRGSSRRLNEADGLVSGLGYTMEGSWHRLRAALHEMKPFTSSGGLVT